MIRLDLPRSPICVFAVLLLTLVLLLTAPRSAFADLEAGLEAKKRGDYETAYKELLPLAEAGNAEAQYRIVDVIFAIFRDTTKAETFGKAFYFLELAAKQGHTEAQRHLANYYMATGEPDNFDKGIIWAQRAIASGQDEHSIGALWVAYCWGPEYHRNLNLAAAWYALGLPDSAFAQEPAVLDEKWEEVRRQWEEADCFDQVEITKDFVRAAHRRARALSDIYGLPMRCLGWPFCPDLTRTEQK